ncbi:hypothetical protein BGX30_008623, partial [Mortierella sp. GBA39]
MTVTKTNRLFTLTAAALLAMIALSASSTSAAPVSAPDANTLFRNAGESVGTVAGSTLPKPMIEGGLQGYNEVRGNGSPSGDEASPSAVDKTLETAGRVVGKVGTVVAPAPLVDAAAAAAKNAA